MKCPLLTKQLQSTALATILLVAITVSITPINSVYAYTVDLEQLATVGAQLEPGTENTLTIDDVYTFLAKYEICNTSDTALGSIYNALTIEQLPIYKVMINTLNEQYGNDIAVLDCTDSLALDYVKQTSLSGFISGVNEDNENVSKILRDPEIDSKILALKSAIAESLALVLQETSKAEEHSASAMSFIQQGLVENNKNDAQEKFNWARDQLVLSAKATSAAEDARDNLILQIEELTLIASAGSAAANDALAQAQIDLDNANALVDQANAAFTAAQQTLVDAASSQKGSNDNKGNKNK